MDQLVDVRQAAARLNVSPLTVRRLLRAGDLAAYRIGARIRIPAGSLDSYLAEHQYRPR